MDAQDTPAHPCQIIVPPDEYTCLRCGETVTPALLDKEPHSHDLYCIRCNDDDGPPAPLVPTTNYLRLEEIEPHAYRRR